LNRPKPRLVQALCGPARANRQPTRSRYALEGLTFNSLTCLHQAVATADRAGQPGLRSTLHKIMALWDEAHRDEQRRREKRG